MEHCVIRSSTRLLQYAALLYSISSYRCRGTVWTVPPDARGKIFDTKKNRYVVTEVSLNTVDENAIKDRILHAVWDLWTSHAEAIYRAMYGAFARAAADITPQIAAQLYAEQYPMLGYDANGKAITKNVLGKTQAEVKDKLRAAIEDSKKLDPVKAGSYTLEQWLKLWYSIYVEPQVRYSTREFYHNAIDHHIIPKLGSVKLEKLTMLQIQQFYNELLKSGRVQKKNQPELKEHGLSPRMVQCVHVVLNKALEYAVEEKLILANPAKKCKIPKNTRKEMKILPEALIGPYLSAAKEHGILAPMYLELTTGLRRGELLALRWEDLDVQNRTLSINKSVARQNGKLVISTPKTPNSIRTVLLPEDTVKLLVEEHERHPANPYLFPSPRTGETWDPDGFRRLHDRIIKEIGAEHVRFHDMRHTFATLSLKSGVDVRTLSETLGHFSAGFTLSTYVHSTPGMKQSEADAIGSTIRNAI